MRILVACEESQAVTIELRRLGHEAYSCDIQDCSGGHPEWHIKGDVIPLLNGRCRFQTMDGECHEIDGRWDMIIAHPPCTKLSNATVINLHKKKGITTTKEWREKFFNDRCEAAIFFLTFLVADCERICIENPDGYMNTHFKKPMQHIEPYMFGDPWKKKTGLWLKGLSPLIPTNVIEPKGKWVDQGQHTQRRSNSKWETRGKKNAKDRSKTFPGIARAMAEQWAGDAREEENREEA